MPCVKIKKVNNDQQIAYGEVYRPNEVDSHGDFMSAETIEKMAHGFMTKALVISIDTQHDNVPNGSYPVESFIARENDPDYAPGSWVLGIKVTHEDLWNKIKKGEFNGFSVEAMAKKMPVVASVSVYSFVCGVTEDNDGHSHGFVVFLNDIGRVVRGYTSEENGHTHTIKAGTATEISDGHAHRFFF